MPSRPRSRLVQVFATRSSAGARAARRRRHDTDRAGLRRDEHPSVGRDASAVGAATVATGSSLNPAGSVAACASAARGSSRRSARAASTDCASADRRPTVAAADRNTSRESVTRTCPAATVKSMEICGLRVWHRHTPGFRGAESATTGGNAGSVGVQLRTGPHARFGLEVDQHVRAAHRSRIASCRRCAVSCAASSVVPAANCTCRSTYRREPARRARSLW